MRTAIVVLSIIAAPAFGQSLNVDFGTPGSGPPSSYGAAGLAGFWNSVAGEHTTPNPGPQPFDYILRDLDGNLTEVRLHQFGGMGNVEAGLGGAGDPDGADARLLQDAIVTHSIPLKSCLYFNGLQNGTYEVLMYTWMPNEPQVDSVSFIDFTPGIQTAGGAWPGQHEQGTTYTRFIVNVTDGFMGPHAGLPDDGDPVIGGPLNGIQLRLLCGDAADCGDGDNNGITDDACAFHECVAQECLATPRAFADLGGSFGACAVDGFVNIHDRNLALACFSNATPCAHINLDAGGSFGACAPDGFCNVHDVTHTLEVFSGSSTCSCGPQPELPPATAVEHTSLVFSASHREAEAGALIHVHAHLDAVPRTLHSYQLTATVSGGRRGTLELVDITVEPRKDAVWARDDEAFSAVNEASGALLAGRFPEARNTGTYLATFTYRASREARGVFVIDAHVDDAGAHTAFVGADNRPIAVRFVQPVAVAIGNIQRR